MEESPPRIRIETIGKLTVAAGGLGVLRLIPELIGAGSDAKLFYWFILAADVLLSIAAVAQGLRLSGPKVQASWAGTIAVWSALFGNATAVFLSVLPHVLTNIRAGRLHGEAGVLLPRMLFCLLMLASAPVIVWMLMTRDEPGRPARRTCWSAAAGGLLVGGGYAVAVLVLHFGFGVIG